MTKVEKTQVVPQFSEVAVDQLILGQPIRIGETIGGVQSIRKTFALVTTHADATETTGFRGMKGNLGNRSKTNAPGCACKTPDVANGFLFAFVGAVPNDFAGSPVSGRICERCDRAVIVAE